MVEAPRRGRIRWLRFAGVLAAGLALAALLLTGLAQGALAASFAVSGTSFKISADKLVGTGFVQFGGTDNGADGPHAVGVSGFRTAAADNFCQSVALRGLPLVGDVTLRLVSPGPEGMSATNIVLGVAGLTGDMTLVNSAIGVDASQVSQGPPGVLGQPGGFAQQAEQATVVAPRMVAWSATAYTLRLKNLSMSLRAGDDECF
ncbi:DUF6230 family protein [Actinophytocola sp.]|uniref:DUF6230 family protein n=1 Tax=Actinophytocola sp. TaxID=1872138 RepID=UPI00389A1D3B